MDFQLADAWDQLVAATANDLYASVSVDRLAAMLDVNNHDNRHTERVAIARAKVQNRR